MAPTTPTARICRVCFREFPSGYALGGHMRVHGVLYAEAAMEKERKMLLQQKRPTSKKPPPPLRYGIAATAGAASDQLNWWIDSSAISCVNESDDPFNKIAEPDMELSSSTMDNRMEMTRRKLLYKLRRDPKPNYRFTDQEFAFEQHAVVPGELAVSYASSSPDQVRFSNWPETAYQRRASSSAMKRNSSKMKFEENPISDVGHGDEEETEEEQAHQDEHVEAEEKKSFCRPKGVLRAKRSLITRKARRVAEDDGSVILHDEDPDSASSEVEEDPDMVACLVLLSMATASSVNKKPGTFSKAKEEDDVKEGVDDSAKEEFAITGTDDPDGKFECSSCKKRFSSRQALGGHRASHKKTKGCFARASLDHYADEHNEHEQVATITNTSATTSRWQQLQNLADDSPDSVWDDKEFKQAVKAKGSHECSICHRVFGTGQALGGHKRRHWLAEKPSEASTSSNTLPYGGLQARMLDLNYSASITAEEVEEGMRVAANLQAPPFAPTSFTTAAVAENQRLLMSSSSTHLGGKKVDHNGGGSRQFKAGSMLPTAVAMAVVEQGTTC